MIASTYAYLQNGGDIPAEVDILDLIKRYGADVVLKNEPLSVLRRLRVVETLINAYNERENAEYMAQWEQEHYEHARLLHLALRLALDYGMIDNGE